jgi:hypothetical protein
MQALGSHHGGQLDGDDSRLGALVGTGPGTDIELIRVSPLLHGPNDLIF